MIFETFELFLSDFDVYKILDFKTFAAVTTSKRYYSVRVGHFRPCIRKHSVDVVTSAKTFTLTNNSPLQGEDFSNVPMDDP